MTQDDRAISVYMTAGSMDEARQVARALIDARLAACVNILGPINSVFYWNGVQEEEEVALIAKASRADFEALNAKVREVHSYDCPCVVAWPIVTGDAEFVQWIEDETRGKRGAGG
ncbi:MAG: divalent-cation tolerance protein CutA [Phycisphaeraceae bacterium]